MNNIPAPPPGFTLQSNVPPPPPGFTLDAQQPDPAARYAQLHAALSAMPPEQRGAAVAGLSQQDQQVLQQGQQAVAQQAMDPQARAQDFQNIQAQNVASQSPLLTATQGFGKSFVDTGRGIGELVGAESPQDVAQSRVNDQALMNSGAGKTGNVLGTLAQSAPLIVAAPEALAASSIGKGLILAGTGAAQGYISPYASQGEHVTNTAVGGLTGPIMLGAGKVAGVALTGAATPEARRLISEGVNPTIGQMLGGKANALEQFLSSSPITGDVINAARSGTVNQFNRAAVNKALAPLGQKLPDDIPAGQKAIAWAAQKASEAYDSALENTHTRMDGKLMSSLGNIVTSAPPEVRGELQKVLKNEVLPRLSQSNGQISGRDFKNIMSDLGQARASYMNSAQSTDRATGMALGNIMDAMDGMFERANGAQKMAALDSADAAYKGFATLRDASGAAGRTRQGVFTPGEFLGAVKKGDRTKAKGAFAKGQAYMQDFGNDAQDVLGNTLPNSFSADRWNHTNLAGWLNGAAASPLTLLYAPGIRAAARGVLAPNAGPYRNMLAGMANQYIPQVGSSLLIGANRANLPFAVSPVPPLAIAAPSAR